MRRAFFQQLIALVLAAGLARGGDVASVGDWIQPISVTDLMAGAGSDLQSTYDSLSGATILTLRGVPRNWSLMARRGAGSWHGSVSLQLKRTSDGEGDGTISGGEAYVTLGATDTVVFTGSGNRAGIALQYRLAGVSCAVPPSTYSAPVIFTLQ